MPETGMICQEDGRYRCGHRRGHNRTFGVGDEFEPCRRRNPPSKKWSLIEFLID